MELPDNKTVDLQLYILDCEPRRVYWDGNAYFEYLNVIVYTGKTCPEQIPKFAADFTIHHYFAANFKT